MSGYYADISAWQGEQIDWQAYKQWSSQWDGISRVAMRSSEGEGVTDQNYAVNRSKAEAAGIDTIIYYHYAYPQLNGAQAEAGWQYKVVGNIRSNDLLMLDLEEQVPQATSLWALAWLQTQEKNYASKRPLLYASQSYIESRLTELPLARYPLVLAHWNIAEMPASPIPWPRYSALQLSDSGSVPGIPGKVDINLWCS